MSTGTLTLSDFLLARIAEDEARAYEFHNQLDCDPSFTCVCGYPERIAVGCERDRRIVEACSDVVTPPQEWVSADSEYTLAWYTLKALTLPYADHPDYREEWRP